MTASKNGAVYFFPKNGINIYVMPYLYYQIRRYKLMGRLYNKDMPIETIHNAFGITLRGEIDGYYSFLSPEKEPL